mgnify:CR=1 FL=1
MINAIFEIASSFLEIYLFYAIIALLFPKEWKPRRTAVIVRSLILLGIVLYLNSFSLYSWMPFFIFPGYVGVTSAKMYKVKFRYTISIALFYTLVIYVIDFLTVTLLSLLYKEPDLAQSVLYSIGLERLIYISICKIILLLLYYVLYRNYTKINLYFEGYKFWILITICGFSGGIYLAERTLDRFDLHIAISWMFLIVIIILLIIIFGNYMSRKLEKQNYEFAKTRGELLENNYTNLKNAYESNAKLYHDYKHHISAIQSLVYEENLTGLKEYIDNLNMVQFNLNEKRWTGDAAVNFIINNKIGECEKKGIEFEANIDFPVDSNIKTNDMVVILANLLDNAIEACDRIEQPVSKKIRLIIRRINSMLVIKVENPCFQTPKIIDKRFMTNKKNKYEHGWGLISVENTALKYEGTLRCSYDINKNIFETTVNLACQKNNF